MPVGTFAPRRGRSPTASGNFSTATGIGAQLPARSDGNGGGFAKAFGTGSTADGTHSSASANFSSAFGTISQSTGVSSAAFGNSAQATADNATALGQFARATGIQATTTGWASLASGQGARRTARFRRGRTVQHRDRPPVGLNGVSSTAVGQLANVSGDYGVALGAFSQASQYGTAVGTAATQ